MNELSHKHGLLIAQPGVPVRSLPVLTFPTSSSVEHTISQAIQENDLCLFAKKDGFIGEHIHRVGAIAGSGQAI